MAAEPKKGTLSIGGTGIAVVPHLRDFGMNRVWPASWEARLRFRAAEDLIETGRRAEGEAQLEQALVFYRSVGATFYIERADALLGSSAQTKSA